MPVCSGALQHLRDLGNTLVLVEHDREIIEAADHLVDFGPASGEGGGEITAAGRPAKVKSSSKSLTGAYLSRKRAIPIPEERRQVDRSGDGPAIIIKGARQHNLRNLDVRFPLGTVIAVTGVSGSGKSSLVEDILWKAAARTLHRANKPRVPMKRSKVWSTSIRSSASTSHRWETPPIRHRRPIPAPST